MATPDVEAANVRLALRIAVAATTCLLISEIFGLEQPALSVFTCHLAMVLFPYSIFQKMMERLIGRVIGVSFGLALVCFLYDAPFLLLAAMMAGQTFFFYVNASGRLSYASLMGGLFVGVVVEIGIAGSSSSAAQAYSVSLVGQLLLATAVIFLINWTTGAERIFVIHTRGEPLLPLRPVWLSKSCMVSLGQIVTMFVALWADLPVLPTMISATILTVTALDPGSMRTKALERGAGAILGGAYAFLSMALLAFVPTLVMLLALVFFGMFLAAYFTRAVPRFSYTFMQSGLVLPLVLIGPSGEIGSIETAVQRLIGVAVGLSLAQIVYFSWPWPTSASAQVIEPSH
jgi:uncharacterized membrane protein YccC